MNYDTTASRFLRPPDVARIRRNQRRIRVQHLLVLLRNTALVAGVVAIGLWGWRHVQSSRFAVRSIEVEGAVHTARGSIDGVTQQYVGLNLFQIDIDRVQRDLGTQGWVSRVDIEKKLPDTLRVKITERKPVALVRQDGKLLYVDEQGVPFAEISPRVGDDDLPLIMDAAGSELARSVTLLRDLRARDKEIYSRISEVWPIPPRGFALYDRDLGAVVYANAEDLSAKYRSLYAVLQAEHNPKIEYADLRFADRVVVRRVESTYAQN